MLFSSLEAESQRLGDTALEAILERQETLFARLEAQPNSYPQGEIERQFTTIAREYEALIVDDDDNTYLYLLYGKFLRRIGETERANVMFVKANDLDPEIAVAKQQIGNYLAENGHYAHALAYFLAAIELEPRTAIYHYQVGELLHIGRNTLLSEGAFTTETLDNQMLEAFRQAAAIEPSNRRYQLRYAEAFFDVDAPQWPVALDLWQALTRDAPTKQAADAARLQQARVALKMGRQAQAEMLLKKAVEPELEAARSQLQQQLNRP